MTISAKNTEIQGYVQATGGKTYSQIVTAGFSFKKDVKNIIIGQ